MSITLLHFAKSFINGRLEPYVFAESYIEFYRIERDLKQLDNSQFSEILFSIFCIADMYNPNNDKETYEFNDKQLVKMVKFELSKLQSTNIWNDFQQSFDEFDPNFTNFFSEKTTWENQVNSVFDNLEATATQNNKLTVEKLPLEERELLNFDHDSKNLSENAKRILNFAGSWHDLDKDILSPKSIEKRRLQSIRQS